MFVIIDHMPLVHSLAWNWMGDMDLLTYWVKFFGNPANYLPKTPLGSPFDFVPILVTDTKTCEKDLGIGESDVSRLYWRHKYYPLYKSGRKPTNKAVGNLRDITMDLWLDAGLTAYSQVGFEADDFASYFCAEFPETPKYLMTLDSDWSGLVSDTTYWIDTYTQKANHRKPAKRRENILDTPKMLDRFNNHKDFTGYHLSQPSDIYKAKHVLGDTADTIPEGEQVDLGIISLVSPTEVISPIQLPGEIRKTELLVDLRSDMFGVPNLEWT